MRIGDHTPAGPAELLRLKREFLVPCSYLVLEDLMRLITRRPEPHPEPRAVPADERARKAA